MPDFLLKRNIILITNEEIMAINLLKSTIKMDTSNFDAFSHLALMTPAQRRAARALLDWSQQRLADASGKGIGTVRQFEAGVGAPRNATTEAMMKTLENAGIELLAGNGGGEGARFQAQSFTLLEF